MAPTWGPRWVTSRLNRARLPAPRAIRPQLAAATVGVLGDLQFGEYFAVLPPGGVCG